ncbi:hypothetical protein XH79_20805 [Bradyrhizobium sp. CCBAU 45389]|nr:hypothetical protein [Bradyrhizobium sp. CCBAU 45389]
MPFKHISLVANNVAVVQVAERPRTEVLILRSGPKAASRRMATGEIGAFMVRDARSALLTMRVERNVGRC